MTYSLRRGLRGEGSVGGTEASIKARSGETRTGMRARHGSPASHIGSPPSSVQTSFLADNPEDGTVPPNGSTKGKGSGVGDPLRSLDVFASQETPCV